MKNIFLILLFLTLSISYSQNFSEKWNTIYERYDYVDNQGNLIGYKKWSSIYQRWDYTTLNTNTNRPAQVLQPIEQGGNLELAMRVVNEKQRRYDVNLSKLKEANDVSVEYLKAVATRKGLSYNTAYNRYISEYWNKIMRGNYDISSNSTLESLIDYLTKGVGYIICIELKDCTLYNN